jgi:all-trans-retinol 13,14-reductase
MKIGTSYKQANLASSYDAIVIGSGIGGLTAASLLARHTHKRVLVLERHYTAGGFTHVFYRPGFEWDVGLHYVGGVRRPREPLRRIFDHLTDGELAWADIGEVYDTVIMGDIRFDYVRGRDNLEAAFTRAFPHEASGIKRYFELAESAMRHSNLFFAERVMPRPVSLLLGSLMRRPALKLARRTTGSVVNDLVQDPTLRGLLTAQWGCYGLPPSQSSFFMHALTTGYFARGASYPVGGASRIARAIIPSIEREGGAVVTRAEVSSILIERGRAVGVKLLDDREVRAKDVISDAGAALTFNKLLPVQARPYASSSEGINGLPASIAHVSLYLGFHKTSQELGLPKQNLYIMPGPDHDANFREAMKPGSPIKGCFVSFSSARDPDFEQRYPGHAAGQAMTVIPASRFADEHSEFGKRSEAYAAKKEEIASQLKALVLRELPQLRDAIVHAELSTPLSTAHFCAHPNGEIYGLAHTPARFKAKWLGPRTAIPGLYLTGADASTAGITGAMIGGALTASLFYRGNLMGKIMKAPRRHD